MVERIPTLMMGYFCFKHPWKRAVVNLSKEFRYMKMMKWLSRWRDRIMLTRATSDFQDAWSAYQTLEPHYRNANHKLAK